MEALPQCPLLAGGRVFADSHQCVSLLRSCQLLAVQVLPIRQRQSLHRVTLGRSPMAQFPRKEEDPTAARQVLASLAPTVLQHPRSAAAFSLRIRRCRRARDVWKMVCSPDLPLLSAALTTSRSNHPSPHNAAQANCKSSRRGRSGCWPRQLQSHSGAACQSQARRAEAQKRNEGFVRGSQQGRADIWRYKSKQMGDSLQR